MVIGFYFFTFLLALAMTGINIYRSKKADTRFLLMGIAVTLKCLGRFLLTVSHTVELRYKDGYYYLIKVYGSAHVLYTIFMLMCVALLSYYMIMAIRKRNVISLRIVFVATTFGIAIIVCYMLEMWLNSTIEWLSVRYLLAAMLMTYLFKRFNMYNMSINISHYVDRMQDISYGRRNKTVGYIIEITDKTVEYKYLKAVEAYNDDLEQEVEMKTADVLMHW